MLLLSTLVKYLDIDFDHALELDLDIGLDLILDLYLAICPHFDLDLDL